MKIKCPHCKGTGLESLFGNGLGIIDDPCEYGCEDGMIEAEECQSCGQPTGSTDGNPYGKPEPLCEECAESREQRRFT